MNTEIRELNTQDKDLIVSIAVLHKRAFPDFFLTQLGLPFLRTLYMGYLEDEDSGIIIALKNERIEGLIAYSYDYSGFYKGLIKKHILRFAICSVGAVLRHPSFVKRLLGAFKKSDSVVKTEKYVELASICVDPSLKNKGLGTELINYLKSKVDFDIYEYINLETDADENDAANRFYIKNGFKLSREYTTAEGRKMNEYRYWGKNNNEDAIYS